MERFTGGTPGAKTQAEPNLMLLTEVFKLDYFRRITLCSFYSYWEATGTSRVIQI